MESQGEIERARDLLADLAEPDEYADAIADAELVEVGSETTALEITRTLQAHEHDHGERPYPASTYTSNVRADEPVPIDERFDHPPGQFYEDSVEFMEHGVEPTDCPHCEGGENTCSDCGGDGLNHCPDCSNGKVRCDRCDGSADISCSNCDDGRATCGKCSGEGRLTCTHCEGGEQACENCGGAGRSDCPNDACGHGRGVPAGEVSCGTCGKSGDVTQDCPNCDGSGTIITDDEQNPCTVCGGDGTVTQPCPDCNGGTRGCSSCNGRGSVSCPECSGGTIECAECGGVGSSSCPRCSGGTYQCSECSGSGTQPCPRCEDGQVDCSTCGGDAEVPCRTCGQTGIVTCSHCNGDNELVHARAGEVLYRTTTEKGLQSDLGVGRETFNAGAVDSTTSELTIDASPADRGGEWIERQEVETKGMSTLRVKYAVSRDGERDEYLAYRVGGTIHADDRPDSRMLQHLRDQERDKQAALREALQARREHVIETIEERKSSAEFQQKVRTRLTEFETNARKLRRHDRLKPAFKWGRRTVPLVAFVGALMYFGLV